MKKMKREIKQLRQMLLTKDTKYQEQKVQADDARARLLELEAGPSHQSEGLSVSVDASGNLDLFSLSYDDISDADLSGLEVPTSEVPTSRSDMVPVVVNEVANEVVNEVVNEHPADGSAANPTMEIDQ